MSDGRLPSRDTVQDCPKGYLHKTGEICRKCGRKGVAKKEQKVEKQNVQLDKETLADVIAKLSDGVDKLLRSGLNRRAIVVLLRDSTGCNKSDIERVLDGLQTLARDYAR